MISQNSLIAHVGPSRMTASGIWWSICGCLVLRLIVRVYSKYVETQSHWAHASRPAILLFVLFRFVCRIWILRGPSSSSMSSMNIYTVYIYTYIPKSSIISSIITVMQWCTVISLCHCMLMLSSISRGVLPRSLYWINYIYIMLSYI